MKRLKKIAIALALATSLAGCYAITVPTGRKPNGVVLEKNAPMFLFGLAGTEVTPPCLPAVVETKMGIIDWFLSGLTLGLYTPRTVVFTCSDDK